eukprot:gene4642-7883_t
MCTSSSRVDGAITDDGVIPADGSNDGGGSSVLDHSTERFEAAAETDNAISYAGHRASSLATLVASDAAGYDYFGYSVAISGSTAVVGAYADDDGGSRSGSAYVFRSSDGGATWTEVAKLVASDAKQSANFGYAVAISGSTAVVGAHNAGGDGGSRSGSAYVFQTSDGGATWTEVAKLVASDAAENDFFGRSVAISGSTVVVGASQGFSAGFFGSDSRSAYVFQTSDGGATWTEVAKLVGSDAADWRDYFGRSVAISGSTAVVGAFGDDGSGPDSGSAYVFQTSDGGATWTEVAKLVASDAAEYDYVGYSVAISGSTAVVGAFGDDGSGPDSGSAYVFQASDGGATWTEVAKLVASDAAEYDYFGRSVAISGSTAVVGAYEDNDGGTNSGSAYVFQTSDGGATWTEVAKLVASDAASFDYFGYSVAISGNTAVVGAYGVYGNDASHRGSAYMFGLDDADGQIHTCHTGFTGDGEGDGCADINACVNNECDSDATCADKPAPALDDADGRTCTCNDGFEGTGEIDGCADINACVTNECDSDATCADKPAPALDDADGRTCTCNDGFEGTGEIDGCADINACVTNECDSDATCADKPAPALDDADGRTCTCNDGFEGTGDSSCDPIICLEDEHVEDMKCKACPAGTINPAGDNATAGDTECTQETTCTRSKRGKRVLTTLSSNAACAERP